MCLLELEKRGNKSIKIKRVMYINQTIKIQLCTITKQGMQYKFPPGLYGILHIFYYDPLSIFDIKMYTLSFCWKQLLLKCVYLVWHYWPKKISTTSLRYHFTVLLICFYLIWYINNTFAFIVVYYKIRVLAFSTSFFFR